MTKALIVHTDGTKEHRDIETDLDTLQGIVGGRIEYVYVAPGVHVYVNEEGRIQRPPLEVNETATRLAGRWGLGWEDSLLGPCVFLGEGEDGEEGDLPPEWLENVR